MLRLLIIIYFIDVVGLKINTYANYQLKIREICAKLLLSWFAKLIECCSIFEKIGTINHVLGTIRANGI